MDAIYADAAEKGRYAVRFTECEDGVFGDAVSVHGSCTYLRQSPNTLFYAWLERVVGDEVQRGIDDDRYEFESERAA